MRKIIKITESQLKQMVKRMIMEQPTTSKYTRENPLKPKNDPYEYAYEDNVLYTKKRESSEWVELPSSQIGKNVVYDIARDAIIKKHGTELNVMK